MAETQSGSRCVHFALAKIELHHDQLEKLRLRAADESVELQFTNTTEVGDIVEIGRIDFHAYTLGSLDTITNFIKDQLKYTPAHDATALEPDFAPRIETTRQASPQAVEMQPVFTLTPEKQQHAGLFGKLLRH